MKCSVCTKITQNPLQCGNICLSTSAIYCTASCARADWAHHEKFCLVAGKRDNEERASEIDAEIDQLIAAGGFQERLHELFLDAVIEVEWDRVMRMYRHVNPDAYGKFSLFYRIIVTESRSPEEKYTVVEHFVKTAKIAFSDAFGSNTILHYACLLRFYNNPDIVKLLLTSPRVKVNARNEAGETALHCCFKIVANDAPYISPTEYVRILLNDPRTAYNLQDPYGFSALMIAVEDDEANELECVKMLMRLPNIKPNLVDRDGNTALHHAALNGFANSVEVILAHPETNPNILNIYGDTPLVRAVYFSDQIDPHDIWGDMRPFFEDPKTDLNLLVGKNNLPFLFIVAVDRHINDRTFQHIVRNPRINVRQVAKNMQILNYVLSKEGLGEAFVIRRVSELLRHPEVDVNSKDLRYGTTPLMDAVFLHYNGCVGLLAGHKNIDFYARNMRGELVFDTVRYDDVPMRHFLLAAAVQQRFTFGTKQLSKLMNMRRLTDELCKTLSTDAHKDDLLFIARTFMAVPEQYMGELEAMTKSAVCDALSVILAIGGSYDREMYLKGRAKKREYALNLVEYIEKFKAGLLMNGFSEQDVEGKTLRELIEDAQRRFA
jgi:hypothetical protein